jgi:hypothetical protein
MMDDDLLKVPGAGIADYILQPACQFSLFELSASIEFGLVHDGVDQYCFTPIGDLR